MGSSTGVTRGQLRPHFSGRSPPFVLAALCVGLGLLAISYWSLCQEYNQLEDQLKKSIIRKDSIESDLTFIQKQLNQREEEFSRAKQTLHQTDQDLTAAKIDIKSKAEELHAMLARVDSLKENNDKCNEELNKKSGELTDVKLKLDEVQQSSNLNDKNHELDELRQQNKQLETQLNVLRKELHNNTKSGVNMNMNNKNETNSVTSDSNANLFSNNDNNDNAVIEPNKSNVGSNKSETLIEKPIETDSAIKDANVADNQTNDKPEQAVIAPPAKDNTFMNNALADEDRKEEGLVEANGNEMDDQLKADAPNDLNKESEDKPNI